MQKITPFLWFNNNLEEAVNFYISVFQDSKIISSIPGPDGKIMSATFKLNGLTFTGLNGGPMYKFSEAISFFITCEDQKEVDYYWEKLSEGGEEGQCGWLKDKFGLSWQVVPKALGELLSDKNGEKAGRVMQAMLKMQKIVIEDLQKA